MSLIRHRLRRHARVQIFRKSHWQSRSSRQLVLDRFLIIEDCRFRGRSGSCPTEYARVT